MLSYVTVVAVLFVVKINAGPCFQCGCAPIPACLDSGISPALLSLLPFFKATAPTCSCPEPISAPPPTACNCPVLPCSPQAPVTFTPPCTGVFPPTPVFNFLPICLPPALSLNPCFPPASGLIRLEPKPIVTPPVCPTPCPQQVPTVNPLALLYLLASLTNPLTPACPCQPCCPQNPIQLFTQFTCPPTPTCL